MRVEEHRRLLGVGPRAEEGVEGLQHVGLRAPQRDVVIDHRVNSAGHRAAGHSAAGHHVVGCALAFGFVLGRTDRRLRRVEGLVPPDEPQLGEHGQARGDVGRHIGPVDAGFACPVGDGGIDIDHTVARRQQGAGGGVQLVGGLGDQVVGHSAVTQRGHQHAGGTLRERRHPGEASCPLGEPWIAAAGPVRPPSRAAQG